MMVLFNRQSMKRVGRHSSLLTVYEKIMYSLPIQDMLVCNRDQIFLPLRSHTSESSPGFCSEIRPSSQPLVRIVLRDISILSLFVLSFILFPLCSLCFLFLVLLKVFVCCAIGSSLSYLHYRHY